MEAPEAAEQEVPAAAEVPADQWEEGDSTNLLYNGKAVGNKTAFFVFKITELLIITLGETFKRQFLYF